MQKKRSNWGEKEGKTWVNFQDENDDIEKFEYPVPCRGING